MGVALFMMFAIASLPIAFAWWPRGSMLAFAPGRRRAVAGVSEGPAMLTGIPEDCGATVRGALSERECLAYEVEILHYRKVGSSYQWARAALSRIGTRFELRDPATGSTLAVDFRRGQFDLSPFEETTRILKWPERCNAPIDELLGKLGEWDGLAIKVIERRLLAGSSPSTATSSAVSPSPPSCSC